MKKVKSFLAACKVLGITPTLPDVSMIPDKGHAKAIVAWYKLTIIAQAINNGWKPNWNNGDWDKYYPWFDMKNGFSFSYVGRNCQCSSVGSRLCFRSREAAEYAGTTFLKLYKDAYVLPK